MLIIVAVYLFLIPYCYARTRLHIVYARTKFHIANSNTYRHKTQKEKRSPPTHSYITFYKKIYTFTKVTYFSQIYYRI
jgi:hypothetical protein